VQRDLAALYKVPSIFVLTGASNAALQRTFIVGFVIIALLALGVLPPLMCVAFGVVYGSFTTVAQPWMGLQFEPLLIETNLVYAIGVTFHASLPWLWVWLERWLIFRLMLAAGAGKLSSSDASWKNGACACTNY
jgi:hypothetical protein